VAQDLYSDRTGQGRSLSTADFMTLMWEGIVGMRRGGFFDAALGAVNTFPADPGYLTEADFIRVLKVAGTRQHVEGPYSNPPRMASRDVPLLFDLIEFLYAEATPEEKQAEFRERLSPDLGLFVSPMEMSAGGLIVERGPDELHALVAEPVPDVPLPLADPLRHAIEQYRRRGASSQDKRTAIKQLADVLEPLRRDVKEHLSSKDESDLFQIVNRFSIRHNMPDQKRDYDGDVWLDWMFYVYVATARALIAVIGREQLHERVTGELPKDGGLF
jgi:hypothetical protein